MKAVPIPNNAIPSVVEFGTTARKPTITTDEGIQSLRNYSHIYRHPATVVARLHLMISGRTIQQRAEQSREVVNR